MNYQHHESQILHLNFQLLFKCSMQISNNFAFLNNLKKILRILE